METRIYGFKQENIALKFLKKRGLKLIEQNYNTKLGEVDLIMREGNTIIFIEVRYRRSSAYGSACESVTYYKQQKIIKASTVYLQRNNLYDRVNIRFDIIAISSDSIHPIEWVKNAF